MDIGLFMRAKNRNEREERNDVYGSSRTHNSATRAVSLGANTAPGMALNLDIEEKLIRAVPLPTKWHGAVQGTAARGLSERGSRVGGGRSAWARPSSARLNG